MRILLANLTKMVDDTGGLAKVTASFANEMHRRGHSVSLVYSDVRTGNFYYPVDMAIETYDLCHYEGKSKSIPLWYKLKRELLRSVDTRKARAVNNDFTKNYLLDNLKSVLNRTKPDVIVSFQPAASKALLIDLKVTIPVITMSHGDPEDYFHIYPVEEIPAIEQSKINQVLLPSFATHITNHLPNAKTIVIGNAIPRYEQEADLLYKKENYKIIFVARLDKNHKRPHILIEAFAPLAKQYPNWTVEIWGAEDRKIYKKELEYLIASNHLEKQVHLMGTTTDVPSVLQQGDIFAFPSAYEGFGMSLGEAMSMGLPVIGYKSCPAVNELIINGKTGILCDDGIKPFSDALEQLMNNQNLRAEMGKAGRIQMEQYAPQSIWNKWEELLVQVCNS
jgi:glycosyltransferase, group 1 family protein